MISLCNLASADSSCWCVPERHDDINCLVDT